MLSEFGDEAVADPRFAQQVLRMRRIGLDLPAKLPDQEQSFVGHSRRESKASYRAVRPLDTIFLLGTF
jgi:hypothetical protein